MQALISGPQILDLTITYKAEEQGIEQMLTLRGDVLAEGDVPKAVRVIEVVKELGNIGLGVQSPI